MKLLVLGASGQLGQDLMAAAGASPSFEATGLDEGHLDLRQLDSIGPCLTCADFDVLVNCAAYTAVDHAELNAETAFCINAYAVERIAQVCSGLGRRLLHVSTDHVFDGEGLRPYRPEDAPGPLNVYGASKLGGEALARRSHPHGTIILRTASLFGLAGAQPGGSGNFVETMIRMGRDRPRLKVVNDVVMAPTYSADLAQGILALLEADAGVGTYHLTNDGCASWYEFAVEILAQAHVDAAVEPIPSSEYPTRARRPRFSVLDTGKTSNLIGPFPHWKDALSLYLARRPLTECHTKQQKR